MIGSKPIAANSSSITVPVQITNGTGFGTDFISDNVNRTDWGELTFSFPSCDSGTLQYNSALPGFGSGSLEMTRLTNTQGLVCQDNPDDPVFITSSCGSIRPNDTSHSSNINEPALFSLNSIIGGRIDPEAVANKTHYWNVDLVAGNYHLVLDSATIDGRDTNIGLEITELDLSGVEIKRLIRVNKIDKRIREHLFLEVETDRTLRLRIEPKFNAEDYFIGIFQNTFAVPSPHFTDCFPVENMTIGVTQNIALANDDEQWFTIDVNAKDYKLTVDAARTDGKKSNIIYEITTLDRFGQASREKRIIRGNEIDTFISLTGMLNVTESGSQWVRVRNANPPLTLDVTFTEE